MGIKTCNKCGNGFECQPVDCWCQDYQLSKSVTQQIHQKYGDCLCPACLKQYDERK